MQATPICCMTYFNFLFQQWLHIHGPLLRSFFTAVCSQKYLSPTPINAPEANLAEAVAFSISPSNDKYRNAAVALELKKVQTKGKVTKYTQMKNGIPVYGTVLTARKNSKGRP